VRLDLLKRMASYKEIDNVIVLTHNFDGVFVESLVLPSLRKSGNPTLTIFSDASCAIEAYESQKKLLSGLGFRYRLVPVELPHPFRFHPKAILLSAPERATLFVGSGNLGFGGWRENGEIWAEYTLEDNDQHEAPAFAYFKSYLLQILDWIPIAESVRDDIEEAFGSERKRWVEFLGESGLLIGRVGKGPSLIDLVQPIIINNKAKRLWICSPYYDEKGEAIQKLLGRFSAKETIVLLQERHTNLTSEAIPGISKTCVLKSTSFKSLEESATRFVHAKFYGIEDDEDKVTVVFGSANCSNAAWFVPGKGGNAELIGIQEMSKQDFADSFLTEIEVSDNPPKLSPIKIKEEGDNESKPQIRVLAARFMKLEGTIRVGFRKNENVQITECFINDQPWDFQENEGNELIVKSPLRPISLRLKGISPDGEILSNIIWIDHEFELSASSKERSLVDTIHRNVRDGIWGLPAWIDIMKLLQDHLDYLAPRGVLRTRRQSESGEESAVIRFTRSDVFSKDFGLFSRSKISFELSQNRLDGLRQLILRWFGFYWETEEAEPDETDIEPGEDGPVEPKEPKLPHGKAKTEEVKHTDQELLQKERRRAADFLKKVVNKISETEYLEKRPPELISKDIGIISILMTSALSEGWLSEQEYFEETYKIWRRAFFDDSEIMTESKKHVCGYLERLFKESDDPNQILEAMATEDFAAALSTWALATHREITSPEQALLCLSQIMAIARLPWIWRLDAIDELRDRIRHLLIHTGLLRQNDDKMWRKFCDQWDEMIKTGYALGKFENAFKDFKIDALKKMVKRNKIRKGELLWQTAEGGFYVLREDSQRKMEKNAEVLKLKGQDPAKMIRSDFLIPLKDLMDCIEDNGLTDLPKEVPQIIKKFINTIAPSLGSSDRII